MCAKSLQPCPTCCDATDHTLPGSSVHRILQARIEYCNGLPCPSPRNLPNPGIKFASVISPASAGVFFTICATWEAPNTRVGSHSLLQGIFPTQGSKPGVPHCRWVLYQLSHQGSPIRRAESKSLPNSLEILSDTKYLFRYL